MTTRIRLINSMLATTGTAPLSASDTMHPSYKAANAILEDVLEEFSSQELWFNTSIRVLTKDNDGRVLVPANTMTCDPTDGNKNYSIRGQFLFDNNNSTDVINQDVECIIISKLDIEELPPAAYQYLRAQARYEYYVDQDGSGTKLQTYREMVAKKYSDLITMNMKMQDTNFFNSPAYINFLIRRRGAGGRGYYSKGTSVDRNLLGTSNYV
jgi:hypothetical protein